MKEERKERGRRRWRRIERGEEERGGVEEDRKGRGEERRRWSRIERGEEKRG